MCGIFPAMDTALIKFTERLTAQLTFALIALVAIKNWNLYRQIRRLESRLNLHPSPR